MTEHWSKRVYVLCWCDTKSNNRRRISVDVKRENLARMAAELPNCADAILYDGFGQRISLGAVAVGATARKRGAKRMPRATAARATIS